MGHINGRCGDVRIILICLNELNNENLIPDQTNQSESTKTVTLNLNLNLNLNLILILILNVKINLQDPEDTLMSFTGRNECCCSSDEELYLS